jgi:hypothetical protein
MRGKSASWAPPWIVDKASESFYIRDAKGQALAYVYFDWHVERNPPRPVIVSTRPISVR